MILRRSFRNELANSAGGVFTVIFSIVLTVELVGVLHKVANGNYDPTEILEVTVYMGLAHMAPLMTASLFIAVLIVLIRSWQDNEMIVWFSAGGRSLLDWILPVAKFSFPFVLLIAALSFVIGPWAKAQMDLTARAYEQRDDVSRISSGRFVEADGGRRVFFVEEVPEDGSRVKNVFMSIREPDKETVVEAESGEIRRNSLGDRYIVLFNGHRYDLNTTSDKTWRVIDFRSYEVRIDVKSATMESSSEADKIPFSKLMQTQTPNAHGQMLWRFCWPFAAMILSLMAIPLSCTNVRAGRNFNLIAAALVFILYLNSVSIGVSYVKTERLDWLVALILINGAFLSLTVLLFVRHVWMQQWIPKSVKEFFCAIGRKSKAKKDEETKGDLPL